jgi:hypothetical protein
MTEAAYQFTQDWWSGTGQNSMQRILPSLPGRQLFCEVGSYEGRSMAWLVEHGLEDGGALHCIDVWGLVGPDSEHANTDMQSVEARFAHNMREAKRNFPKRSVTRHKNFSLTALTDLAARHGFNCFDFVYVDGSHTAADTLLDAAHAWCLLKMGGVLLFDDYAWLHHESAHGRPAKAIDAFIDVMALESEVIFKDYQVAVRKTKETPTKGGRP